MLASRQDIAGSEEMTGCPGPPGILDGAPCRAEEVAVSTTIKASEIWAGTTARTQQIVAEHTKEEPELEQPRRFKRQ
jgi:hypothetical protein